MGSVGAIVGRILLASLLICTIARPARGDEDIPTYQVLTCQKDCPVFVPAKVVSAPPARFPGLAPSPEGGPSEGIVDVDYTIGPDGTVTRAVVENLIGRPAFADTALEAVKQRTFEPATENGKPVAETRRVRFVFRFQPPLFEASSFFGDHYNHALSWAQANDISDAIEELARAAREPSLSLFERAMANNLLAELYAHSGDYMSAREASRIATIEEGVFLDKRALEPALRLRITLEAKTGEWAEAFAWFEILKRHVSIKDDDHEAQLIARLHSALDGTADLAIDAEIPKTSPPNFWFHTLLRRSIEFRNVEGKLDTFELYCGQHAIRSPVSVKADWAIPPSWSGCYITVTGTPGTRFQLLELPPLPK
jgi:TonB family protein